MKMVIEHDETQFITNCTNEMYIIVVIRSFIIEFAHYSISYILYLTQNTITIINFMKKIRHSQIYCLLWSVATYIIVFCFPHYL